MKFLLDTHILIWFLTDDEKLPREIFDLIKSSENETYFSLVSIWESEIKNIAHPTEFNFSGELLESLSEKSNLNKLSIKTEHISLLKTLNYSDSAPRQHKDPFDRLLICQAKSENMKLITHDTLIPFYDEKCVYSV